jgi:hypothetical protein
MSKIVYLPLDERPCNYKYPQQLSAITDLTLTVPPLELLGDKKQPAEPTALADWLLRSTKDADHLIVSIDMLVYGGIVPSRLHHMIEDDCARRMDILKQCKSENPNLRIYAFNLIMRAPAYNNSDEEPDYYALHGADLHRYGWLLDKSDHGGLNTDESTQLDNIRQSIPESVLNDFIGRRKINTMVNGMSIELIECGVIDHLVIPLDDNSLYGFTSKEQRELLYRVESRNLMDRIMIYPGADEIGCILFARVFCLVKCYTPEAFIRYSASNGPLIIPRYEDRSLNESIKAHLTSVGAFISDTSSDADLILMVNSPPISQDEAAESDHEYQDRHRSYYSEVNLREFSNAIHAYAGKGKLVALADVATSNGADQTFMQLLAKTGRLSDLSAFAAWNTSGNTLGTVIAHAVVLSYYNRYQDANTQARILRSKRFLLYRLVEDWAYQTVIRKEINLNSLHQMNAINVKPEDRESIICKEIADKLNEFYRLHLSDITEETLSIGHVRLPWHRTFEVDFELS